MVVVQYQLTSVFKVYVYKINLAAGMQRAREHK